MYLQCLLGIYYRKRIKSNYLKTVIPGFHNDNIYDRDMIPLYQEAARQGNPEAFNGLGNRYYYGQGVVQDYQKAMEWYMKAAANGDSNAKEALKKFYN